MRVPGHQRASAGEDLSPAGRTRAWHLVLPRLGDEPARPVRARPPGRLPVAGSRRPRPRRMARRHRRGPHRPLLDRRAVATALAGQAHHHPPDHPTALHPRRRTRPHPVARHALLGQPRRQPAPRHLRQDRPNHQPQGPAAVRLHHAAPAHHAARGAQPGRPRRAPRIKPGPAHRGHQLPQAARPGVDRGAGRGLAAHRPAALGRGVDRQAPRRLPHRYRRRPAVRAVVAHRPARPAPRRSVRAALGRGRPRPWPALHRAEPHHRRLPGRRKAHPRPPPAPERSPWTSTP